LQNLARSHEYAGYEHEVNTHINHLRAKTEDNPAQPFHILCVFGVGYEFFDPEELLKE
jgi:two-component system, OmpR family, alkaline phosphatase synthesis response regulator PhoP